MGEGKIIRTNVLIDFGINAAIKQTVDLKRMTENSETTKEEVFGQMIKERHALDEVLTAKGMTFDELLLTLK